MAEKGHSSVGRDSLPLASGTGCGTQMFLGCSLSERRGLDHPSECPAPRTSERTARGKLQLSFMVSWSPRWQKQEPETGKRGWSLFPACS